MCSFFPCLQAGFSTVLSDLCHPTSGTAAADVILSHNLGEAAASLALGDSFLVEGKCQFSELECPFPHVVCSC